MRVFVTGATGFVGSAVVQELLSNGHQVLGLTRSESGAQTLVASGAQPHYGDLTALDTLRSGVAQSDAVIHTAFNHDFSNFAANCQMDKLAIETLGSALVGSNRPLLVTAGLAFLAEGRPATESDALPPAVAANFPRKSEAAAAALLAQGVNVSVIRLPPSVHGAGDHGFVPILIDIARQKGSAAYVGDGLNLWPAVHRLDAAIAYRLALERNTANTGTNYHVVAEQGVPFKDIAAVIGGRLNLPLVGLASEQAQSHFGWFATFAGIDAEASSTLTRQQLGWTPTHPGLLTDIDQDVYFKA